MDVVFDFIHFKYQSWTTPVACVDLLFNLRRTQYTYSAIILFQFNKFLFNFTNTRVSGAQFFVTRLRFMMLHVCYCSMFTLETQLLVFMRACPEPRTPA